MEHRQLGRSGLQVSVLGLGTMGFGGGGNFANVGQIGVEGATRQLDLCLDAGEIIEAHVGTCTPIDPR